MSTPGVIMQPLMVIFHYIWHNDVKFPQNIFGANFAQKRLVIGLKWREMRSKVISLFKMYMYLESINLTSAKQKRSSSLGINLNE